MPESLSIFIATITSHNIALTYILGMCPMIGVSKNLNTAVGMGMSVTFVVMLTAIINWPIYNLILIPTNSTILTYVIFIVTIGASVQLLEMILEKFLPALYRAFGIFLPLITVNCVVLSVSLFMVLRNYTFGTTLVFAFGSSMGWLVAIAIVAAIREKLELVGDIPKGLKGPGIVMVILGILALGFMGFGGMVNV
ncbi:MULTISPECIES: Rnf-Nqr domain containing protein [unclassified Candidatus Frackibacter]|uniref:Rnf-Nqr domain containing protein n=1 Tax=unclassified Candidatus Frackibacter TaxID=2648818 RepID=UPI000793C222|nr:MULTISPECIES: Rnf-Nqr domain containing protein [unclassified Candidatus Frackibacter]KXS41326.1 MAG: Na+-transporting NADH:ubiquinone oxidoreductase subunit E [Candidatus Frackibacter sp. T328-2]SDC44947.1 Na+-transporting NADH:ubiquinone oxidoreductase subunit E [Candidatus Frackibacter sp. WG11]SEM64904.1 Na+-transporting NADH:ubiquinone oxidoreductase subunit E [Candidatus Frackibacter sp. WG12]SFL67558.1 Na+-transporting NADH:ubiquinone oxidoreductase subunit E [Candidatus Frackibacter 